MDITNKVEDSEIVKAREKLTEMCILEWTGEFRNGQKVWRAVPEDRLTPEAKAWLAKQGLTAPIVH